MMIVSGISSQQVTGYEQVTGYGQEVRRPLIRVLTQQVQMVPQGATAEEAMAYMANIYGLGHQKFVYMFSKREP